MYICSLHVECMVYGNCTAESARNIYTGLVDRLKQQCGTRSVASISFSILIKD